jgi:hypothetical protein
MEAANVRDDNYPYAAGNQTEDSPNANIDAPYCLSKMLSDSRSFDMWLEFQPPGGHWVPLRKVAWGYSGEALLAGTNCTPADWRGTNFTNVVNPTDLDTEQYAWWTNVVSNFGYRQE